MKWEDALPISGFTVDEERIRPSVRYLCWLASGRATGRNIVSYYPPPKKKKNQRATQVYVENGRKRYVCVLVLMLNACFSDAS